jgi:hypothetical protein
LTELARRKCPKVLNYEPYDGREWDDALTGNGFSFA